MSAGNDFALLDQGTVRAQDKALTVGILLSRDGHGAVQLYMRDPSKSKGGEFMWLDEDRWEELKAIVQRVDAKVAELRGEGKLPRIAELGSLTE